MITTAISATVALVVGWIAGIRVVAARAKRVAHVAHHQITQRDKALKACMCLRDALDILTAHWDNLRPAGSYELVSSELRALLEADEKRLRDALSLVDHLEPADRLPAVLAHIRRHGS